MGCIWCICYFCLKTFIFTGCFFQRTATKPALKQYRFRFNESNIQVFHSWLEDSMKFPDHKTRKNTKETPQTTKKNTHTHKKKRKEKTHQKALHVGVRCIVERSAIYFEEKIDIKGGFFHSCKQPPHVPARNAACSCAFCCSYQPITIAISQRKSGDILYQKSCTWYANNLSL